MILILIYQRNPDFQVVFVTGYDQNAIKPSKQSATDYLIKPEFPADLLEIIQKTKTKKFAVLAIIYSTVLENQQSNQLEKS